MQCRSLFLTVLLAGPDRQLAILILFGKSAQTLSAGMNTSSIDVGRVVCKASSAST